MQIVRCDGDLRWTFYVEVQQIVGFGARATYILQVVP